MNMWTSGFLLALSGQLVIWEPTVLRNTAITSHGGKRKPNPTFTGLHTNGAMAHQKLLRNTIIIVITVL